MHVRVQAASDVLRNGWVEATSCERGVGIVKLMGRDAGFIAVNAALASNLVDLVMIPEVQVHGATSLPRGSEVASEDVPSLLFVHAA